MAKAAKRPRRQPPPKPPLVRLPPGSQMVPHVSALQEQLIGRVIVLWARAEGALQDIIWQLLGLGLTDGRLITARLDVRPKLELIEVLAPRRLTDPTLLAEIFNVVDLMRNRQGDRNFIAHGSWGTLMPRNEPAAMSLRVEPDEPDRIVTETFTKKRMDEIIHDLEQAQEGTRKVLRGLAILLGTPPELRRPDADIPPPSPEPP